jgi:hypothetical protein
MATQLRRKVGAISAVTKTSWIQTPKDMRSVNAKTRDVVAAAFVIFVTSQTAIAQTTLPNPLVKHFTDGTAEAIEKMQARQQQRMQEEREVQQRKRRLASITGCSANAARTNCKCFDKSGSVESILNHEQCLAVVDRGLAAVHDF